MTYDVVHRMHFRLDVRTQSTVAVVDTVLDDNHQNQPSAIDGNVTVTHTGTMLTTTVFGIVAVVSVLVDDALVAVVGYLMLDTHHLHKRKTQSNVQRIV